MVYLTKLSLRIHFFQGRRYNLVRGWRILPQIKMLKKDGFKSPKHIFIKYQMYIKSNKIKERSNPSKPTYHIFIF